MLLAEIVKEIRSGEIPVGDTEYACQHPSRTSNPNWKMSSLPNARPPSMKFPGAKHVKLY